MIIGHMAMIHDATIKDCALIGMKSMICDGITIGEWTIVAEQSPVQKNRTLPPNKIYGGSPAREIAGLTQRRRARLIHGQRVYANLIGQYHKTFKGKEINK